MKENHRRPGLHLLALSSLLLASACDLGGGGTDADVSQCNDGSCGPTCTSDPEDDTGRWFLECPEDLEVGPGELLALRVGRVDVPSTELVVWFGEGDDMVIHPAMAVFEADENGNESTEWMRLLVPALVMDEGPVSIALGTEDERVSNSRQLQITHSERRLSQEQIATVIEDGLTGLADDTLAIFENDSASWQQFVEETYSSEQIAPILEALVLVRESGALIADDYRALSPDDEQQLHAILESSGVLQMLEGWALGNPSWTPSMTKFLDEFPLPTLQPILMQFDTLSFSLGWSQLILEGATVLAILSVIAAPVAEVPAALSIAVGLCKFVIDTFIPSDLVDIKAQHSPVMYQDRPKSWVMWGLFLPQNTSQGSQVKSFAEVMGELAKALVPVKAAGQVTRAIVEIVATVAGRLGINSYYAWSDPPDYLFSRVWSVIDSRVYDLTPVTLLQAVPGFGLFSERLLYLLEALSVSDGLAVVPSDPPSITDGTTLSRTGYSRVTFTVDSLGPTLPEVLLDVRARGFRFGSKDLWVTEVPWPSLVTTVIEDVLVKNDRTDSDPNELYEFESVIYWQLGYENIGAPDFVRSGNTDDRQYVINVYSRGGFAGNFGVEVSVNGIVQATHTVMFNTFVPVLVNLVPGKNTIAIRSLNTDFTNCSIDPAYSARRGCASVHFLGGMNADISIPIFFGGWATGTIFGDDLHALPDGTRTFEVWTPPSAINATPPD